MKIAVMGDVVAGSFSWTTGFRSVQKKALSLGEEAKKNLEAVINRLLLEGREDEAERIFDLYA